MSTMPKAWKGWVDLCSDVNWADYHGMWGKKGPDGAWYVLRFTNMEDACGEREAKEMGIRYECSVLRVDLRTVPIEKQQTVLESFVQTDWNAEAREQAIVYGLVADGCAAPLTEESAWSHPERVRAAAWRAAEILMNDYDSRERLLDRPVNAIGTTAREFGTGDIMAGLRRYADGNGEGDSKKDLMLRLQTAPVKRVRTSKLSGECLAVQIWGTAQCASCEYKDGDCGGKEIRRTGTNEKGNEVGRSGLE